ncbi:hypothetical protein [Micromonospora sp. URMC 103]|uniref:hypothetical protein n=1 Tax=Micromonospora sp. URMC 103 TaxID=3423406 RepID=UPI003F1DF76F
MRRILTTIALLPLSLSVALAPTPASAAEAVDVTSATLVARGVAVDVTLDVTCPAGMTGSIELSIRQRSGGLVAYGSGWAPLSCTGEAQAVTGRVLAQPGGPVFRTGEALVTGNVELCGAEACDYAQVDDTVRVRR